MNQPPTTMTIELEEKDVRNDLPEVVNSMSKMRAETIKDRKLTDQQKDEYLHMSYRLASGIQAVADEPMTKRMQVVADRLNKNPTLLRYDPMQDGYWRKQEGRFAEALDDLLIATVRDDFHSVDAKHHVLQAVKYLGVEDAQSKEREKVYDTILPFHGPVPLETREGILKKIFGRLLGNQYKLSNLEGLALNIDATSDGFTDEFLAMARDRGYTTLRVEMTDKDFEKVKAQLKDMQVIGQKDIPKNQRLINFANGFVRYTKPVSYLFLGALPQSLQNRLDRTLPNFSKGSAFTASCWIQIGSSVVGAILLAVAQQNGWYILGGIPTLVDGIARGLIGSDTNLDSYWYYDKSAGSVFLKPVFYPLEKHLNEKPRKTVTIEVPVRKIEASQQVPNPIAFYDAIGKMEVPEDVERNLVWDNENHHQFGKSFMAYVKEHAGTQPQGIEIATSINKPNQAVVYNHELPVDGYRKYSSLFCFNGRRYLVTAVEPNRGTNNFVENASTILADNSDNHKKLERLGKELDARYVHLREYRSGQVASDMEGFG
jgi:hypothetical protein